MNEENAEKVLARAYELRDFEISHYWKRAQYFWGFLAVIFAGYFLILTKTDELKVSNIYLISINCLGIIFSYAWYFTNRGSKKWQQHWENVIIKYEKILNRPVYNEEILVKMHFLNAGNYSVSRINILISITVFLFWLALLIYNLWKFDNIWISMTSLSIIIISGIIFYFSGKSN